MKTIPKLIPALVLVLLAVSCTGGTVTPSPTPTPPPTASPTPSSTVTFDFDSGSPPPSVGQSTPFDYTSGGVTARFSSLSDPAAFSVQNRETTFLVLSQFSRNYLYQNNTYRTNLSILSSQPLASIILTFATIEYHGVGEAELSTVKLTAYVDSTGTTAVGSATARGTLSGDTFPQGTLSFNSGGQPFKLVVIELVIQPRGATGFLVDNVTVTTTS